jgi:hypothetical protein
VQRLLAEGDGPERCRPASPELTIRHVVHYCRSLESLQCAVFSLYSMIDVFVADARAGTARRTSSTVGQVCATPAHGTGKASLMCRPPRSTPAWPHPSIHPLFIPAVILDHRLHQPHLSPLFQLAPGVASPRAI